MDKLLNITHGYDGVTFASHHLNNVAGFIKLGYSKETIIDLENAIRALNELKQRMRNEIISLDITRDDVVLFPSL